MKFRFICTGLLSFFAISFALSQCVPVTLECPDDVTITADPGDCGAFYNYTVQTNGDCNLVSLTQTDASGLTSGDEFPFGTTTQSYSTLDDDGNTDQCTFFVTVLEFPNPITDDACNGNVNISPDDDCEVLVTADMILEGGPYGCYDNYIVSITTTAGVQVPNPITADYIGQTLMASVQDPSGNSCWGYINYEDYIITDLVCQTYTIACGSPTIPSTDTLTGIPFPIPAGYIITPSSGTGPFIVEDYDNCGDIQLSYVDDIDELDCAIGVPFTRIINRNWTAVDGQGNSTTCTDIIQVEVSDISALNVFPDRNGTDAPSILCSGNWDANGDGIPQPDEIGDVLDMNCDVWGTYTDIIHQLQCGVLIDRDWQILNMCTGEHIDFIQQIKLEDDEPPVISCTPVLQGNAQNNCQATYTVPAPDLSDDCSEVTYTVSSSFGTPVNIGSAEYPQYVIYDVPLGTYSITYTAVDGCGNTAQCTSQLVVEDLTPPHINCESQYTVHLGTSDDEVTVEDLLVFYTDGCGIADKKLRRVVQGDCHGQNYDDTQWHDVETFCCEEAGQTIIIEVGVWDIYGNLSTCIVNVVVNSNVAPSMTCPPDITISCSYAFDFQDLTVFGTVVQDPSVVQDIYIDDPDYVEYCKNKPYTGPMYWGRDGLAYSECDLEIREDVTINTECGKSIYENGMYLPAITREFVITNESGEVNSCAQQIYIIDCNPQSTSVDWPADVVIDACLGGSTDPSETGFPTIAAGSCDDISADYVDTFQVGNGDTCQHIIRHWVATSTCSDSSDVIVGEHDQNIYIIKSTPLVFENCPDTIRNELQITSRNLVINGDFEQGPIGFSSQYEMGVLMAGRYIVTPNPGIFNNDHDCVDHTTGNGTGNLLMVDGSPNAGLWAWCQEIDVEMGQSYDVSAWVNNVVKTDRFYEDPNIDFVITTYDEVIMSSGDLPEIPDEWVELSATWIAPESITIELCARSNSSAFVGNDFALDDIAFIGMGTDCALNPDNGCEALIEVAAPTAYDCDTIVDVAWEVDLDYDGTFMADLSGTGSLPTYLPFGEHRIRWSASSMCGEQASCETVLLVEDCEPPMAICEDIGIQILQDTSGITITAEQIAGMSMDNCDDVTAQFLVCEEVNQITENRLFGLADDTLFQIDYMTGEILVKYGIDYPYDNLLGAMTYVDTEEAFYSVRRGVPLGQNPPSLFKLSKTGEILDEIIIQDYDGNVVHQIEALEYDESSGKMYTSVSLDADAALLTETLMEVNLATGELTYITEVRNLDVGSRDMDRFVVEDGNLYYYDYVSDDNTYFFHVDLNSLTPPMTYSEFIFDLGDDYIPGELAVKGGLIYYQIDGDLVSVNPTNGASNVIGQVHTPEEFNGNRIRGLAFADVVIQPYVGEELFGIAGDTIFQIDRNTGDAFNKVGFVSPTNDVIYSLTYFEPNDAFYALKTSTPFGVNPGSIFKFSPEGQLLEEIPVQDYNNVVVSNIGGLVYNPADGEMYITANLDNDGGQNTETLMTIDVETGELTFVTEIINPNSANDVERMVVENNILYFNDYQVNSNVYFYSMDLTALTPPVTQSTFLFDLGSGVLTRGLAINEGNLYYQDDRKLIKHNIATNTIEEIGPIHSALEFGGGFASGFTFKNTDSCFFQNELTIDCSDLEYLQDTFPYTIVVTDQYGLTDTCAGEIIVADSMNLCNPETCEFVYGVTTSGALYSINTADGAIEFVTNVSAPGNTNALGVNASLGLAYFGSEQTVYWVDIDDGSQGVVGDIGVPGSLSAAGASYRNGYYYMGPEIANSIVDIFRVQISADGKSFAGALENLTNGVVPTGNFGDFIVVDGTPGSESMIMSINNGANNDIYDYDVASNTFTLLHQIPAFSSSQIAMDNSGTIWYFDNGDITLGMLDLNTGIVSNSNPTPITFADLGRSYCPGSAFINLPGQVTHADFTRNRPNPFTEGTTIEFTVDKPQVVTLSIISVDGRIIKQSKRHVYEGDNDWYISIDGPAGVYFYRIETADDVFTNSMLKSDRIGE